MAKRKFKCDILSVSSIRNLQKELEKYSDSLTYKAQRLAETLAERGVEKARVHVADLDAIFTGELLESIHSEYVSSKNGGAIFAIVADNEHACFVEFGTGQRGMDVPYPNKLPEGVSWKYASGKTIRKNSLTGRYYWFYPVSTGDNEEDKVWYYTEGMQSRPFMYETSLDLYKIVEKTAKEIFGK
jgi:hypothetical protein